MNLSVGILRSMSPQRQPCDKSWQSDTNRIKLSGATEEKRHSWPDPAHVADCSGVPGCLFPFGVLTLPEADFIQLGEQGVGDVFLVAILCPQQKLHPLSWCICCSKWDKRRTSGERERRRKGTKHAPFET